MAEAAALVCWLESVHSPALCGTRLSPLNYMQGGGMALGNLLKKTPHTHFD